LVSAGLSLSGCGIESITFVEGPLEDEITPAIPPSVAVISFRHNDSTANQSDDFLGYELYYKLYDDALTDPWIDDNNSILAEPVPTGVGRLNNRGYRRVIRNEAPEAIPTILVTNKGLGYTIELDFFDSGFEPNATASWNDGSSTTINLRRNSDPTAGVYKSFFDIVVDSFVEDDEDVDEEIEDAAGSVDYIGVALYALGYGIEGGTFRQLYSEAVFLGYLELQP
jgi:hypothetical protein